MWIDKEFFNTIESVLETFSTNEKIDEKKLFDNFSANKYKDVINVLKRQKELTTKTINDSQEQVWIKSGISQLSKDTLSSDTIQKQCKNAINNIARYTNSGSGAIFVLDKEDKKLKLQASFAYTQREQLSNIFDIGESVVGQVALEQTPIVLTNVSKEQKKITTALSTNTPNTIYTYPITYQQNLVGVLEISSFEEIIPKYQTFLEEGCELLGHIIFSTLKTEQIDKLLKEAKEQTEELQQVNQRLISQNEELEEQRQSIIEQNQELESQKSEIEQAQEEVKQKAYQLESSNKYKSEFLANMSHELRTPLNSINLLSNILAENKEHNLSQKQIERLNTINQSGEDLLRLINDILNLSKIEANMMSLSLSTIDISQLALQLYDHFKIITEEKSLNLSIDIPQTIDSQIYTDKEKIRQILKNFISNAIKFTQMDGNIKIILKQTDDKEYPLSISIEDSGIGISDDKLNDIFEAFKQADGSTSRKYGGTGLGLSISKKLAQLCSAKIEVKSKLDNGSTFTLLLPKKINTKEINKELIEIIDNNDKKTPIDNKLNSILIIEDDEKFARILKDEIEKKHLNAIIAPNGRDGLNMAIKYKPNGIILDMNLPILNGWEVLKNLKNDIRTKHIPVKIVSVDEPNIATKSMGAIEYIQKPVTIDRLDKAINSLIKKDSKKIKDLLIVEDNKNLRESLVELLSESDINISAVEDASSAINTVKTKEFDCAIIDIGLPDMDGLKLLKTVKKHNCNLPIIVYTGKEFTTEQLKELREYSESIVLKTAQSEKRLIEETTLFLHRLHNNLNEKQKNIITKEDKDWENLKNKNVLIVDDDMRNVFALSSVLEDNEINTTIATNGKEAIETINNNIDIVLMDIMMPIMDGYEAIKILKNGKYKNIPIIALTAKSQKEDKQKCLEAGANDYLSKPVDYNQLLQLIKILTT
jgi:signal transduction histidine kinase/DNA-binding response OmpR family regulator